MTNAIDRYFGTFIGLSPTDESKIAMGEIEVTIDERGLKIRHATGLSIREYFVQSEQVRTLSEAEVRQQFDGGSVECRRVDGFQLGAGATLLFWRNPSKARGFWFWSKPAEARLVIRPDCFVETLGITTLFDKAQVADGHFEQIIESAIKSVGQFPFPRLKYGGLHEPEAN